MRTDWRNQRGEPRYQKRTCCVEGCSGVAFPGLLHCFLHTDKDALAVLVEDAIRQGYRPGVMKVE